MSNTMYTFVQEILSAADNPLGVCIELHVTLGSKYWFCVICPSCGGLITVNLDDDSIRCLDASEKCSVPELYATRNVAWKRPEVQVRGTGAQVLNEQEQAAYIAYWIGVPVSSVNVSWSE